MDDRSVRFWRRYFWVGVVPALLVAILVMSSGDKDWSAAAYIGWMAVTAPWAWAVVTRRARIS